MSRDGGRDDRPVLPTIITVAFLFFDDLTGRDTRGEIAQQMDCTYYAEVGKD